MGVSIYYTARREHRLTEAERSQADRIVTEENATLFASLDGRLAAWKEEGAVPSEVSSAGEVCEGLTLYRLDGTEPEVILEGASKISHSDCEPEPMFVQLEYYMRFALSRLRRAVPGAEWDVHVDDTHAEWDEETGEYVFTLS